MPIFIHFNWFSVSDLSYFLILRYFFFPLRTVEINNTDAEGRLVLGDGVS